MDPRLEPILDRTPAWLELDGPEADVVIASRVRLARNLADRPFPRQLDGPRAGALCTEVSELLAGRFRNGLTLDPDDLEDAEADFLIERSLATRDLFESAIPTRVLFLGDGTVGLMVNEEDHFRAQGFAAGLDLERAHRACSSVTDLLAREYRLARHERYGFLTACPTNVGSGMRASLMMHLPALARERAPRQQMLNTARTSNLAVRGAHGEGSHPLGDLYQISNQVTLGRTTRAQLAEVADFGRQMVAFERSTREALVRDAGKRRDLLEDARSAWETLTASDRLATSQALQSLSVLRLALLAGLGRELDVERLPKPTDVLTLCFQLQPGHLQARFGQSLDPERRDVSRSHLVRRGLLPEQGD